jgi:hypothetical protein
MLVFYSCNCRVYDTQVSRLVLRILYAHAVLSGGTVVEALRYKPEGRGIDSG